MSLHTAAPSLSSGNGDAAKGFVYVCGACCKRTKDMMCGAHPYKYPQGMSHSARAVLCVLTLCTYIKLIAD